MGINVTSGPSDTMIIDVTPEPSRWRLVAILILAGLLVMGIAIFLLTKYAPYPGTGHASGGGHSGGSAGGGVMAMLGPLMVVAAQRNCVKKITLGPRTIEIVRPIAKQPEILDASQIKSCTTKKLWKGGSFAFEAKYGKKITRIAATDALFPVLKAELQKRYSFPIT